MDCIIRITFLLLATFGCQTAGKLIMKPKDTDAKVNHSTYINCSTDYGPTAIFWFHGSKYVYTGNEILEPYHVRYAIDRKEWNGTYIYNLIINSVQPGDEGKYICAEDEGVGEQYSVQLVVLEKNPICESTEELDGVIGQNACNIEPDYVEIHCIVTYHGNIPPNMEWKRVGDGSFATLNASIITTGNRFVSTLKVKGDIALNNSSFVCETRRTTVNPIKCTSQFVTVLYAVSDNSTVKGSINEEIHCNANTSQSCNYMWKWLQDDDFTIESSTSVLKARKLGWHRCEAECHLRNQTCNLLVKRAMIYTDTESSQTRTGVLSVVVSVLVVGVLICVILWIVRKRGGSNTEKGVASSEPLKHLDQPISAGVGSTRKFTSESNAKPVEIRAIATLDMELFILRLQRSFIEVYNSETFDFLRRVNINDCSTKIWIDLTIIHPDDIASCSIKNCLYAYNKEYHSQHPSIIRFDPTTGVVIANWIISAGCRISVASDTNVILTMDHRAELHEYTAEGKRIREIDLSSGTGIRSAWHAAKLKSGLIVVAHGDTRYGDDSTGRVCLLLTKIATIDTIGTGYTHRVDKVEIVKEFGRVDGNSINILGRPFYLSVDKEGSILVLDGAKNRAVLLSSNLDTPRIVVSKEHGMNVLRRMCFNDTAGQWLLSDFHRIMVCQMKDEEFERKIHDLPSGDESEDKSGDELKTRGTCRWSKIRQRSSKADYNDDYDNADDFDEEDEEYDGHDDGGGGGASAAADDDDDGVVMEGDGEDENDDDDVTAAIPQGKDKF